MTSTLLSTQLPFMWEDVEIDISSRFVVSLTHPIPVTKSLPLCRPRAAE